MSDLRSGQVLMDAVAVALHRTPPYALTLAPSHAGPPAARLREVIRSSSLFLRGMGAPMNLLPADKAANYSERLNFSERLGAILQEGTPSLTDADLLWILSLLRRISVRVEHTSSDESLSPAHRASSTSPLARIPWRSCSLLVSPRRTPTPPASKSPEPLSTRSKRSVSIADQFQNSLEMPHFASDRAPLLHSPQRSPPAMRHCSSATSRSPTRIAMQHHPPPLHEQYIPKPSSPLRPVVNRVETRGDGPPSRRSSSPTRVRCGAVDGQTRSTGSRRANALDAGSVAASTASSLGTRTSSRAWDASRHTIHERPPSPLHSGRPSRNIAAKAPTPPEP